MRLRSRKAGITLALMGLAMALLRLPLIRTPIDVSPDGCEYLGIARHLVTESRWVSSIKWHFFTDDLVVHPALADRPPLYPLWASLWVLLSPDPASQVWIVRVGNLLLAAALPVLIYWSLRGAVLPLAAFLAALSFSVYPAFLRISSQPLTEPLFLALLIGSLGLFLRARTPGAWFTSGCLAGLAFLTRPSGILLPLVYLPGLLYRCSVFGVRCSMPADPKTEHRTPNTEHQTPAPSWLPLLLVLAGFLLPLVPYWIAVDQQTGSPTTSILRYNYSIRHIDEGTFYGFERTFPAPVEFVCRNATEVVRLIGKQWETMGAALMRSLQFLLPLALFWRQGGLSWGHGLLIGLALLNFLFHAMSWTVWGAARYMFPSYLLAMALLMDTALRWAAVGGQTRRGEGGGRGRSRHAAWLSRGLNRRRLGYTAMALSVGGTLTACVAQDLRLYREKAQPFAGVHMGWAYAAAGARLAQTPPGSVCAANQPWIINLLAQRPAAMAPRFRDLAQLRRYLSRYRPATLTLFVTEREPGDVKTAEQLVDGLWGRPIVRREVAKELELLTAEHRVVEEPVKPPDQTRQALLIFRVLPGAGSQARG